jgi:hypothetical protein
MILMIPYTCLAGTFLVVVLRKSYPFSYPDLYGVVVREIILPLGLVLLTSLVLMVRVFRLYFMRLRK